MTDRREAITRVLADPPLVHMGHSTVWKTERSAYELMADLCPPGAKTLETGLGISTVLFTAWGTAHDCVVASQAEVDACLRYLDQRGIESGTTTFHVGSSADVLPRLAPRDLDLVFIDGCHGWPMATIDWFYAASMLRSGGVVIIDDTSLRSVSMGLLPFLAADPRWRQRAKRPKWVAYERLASGSLCEEYVRQEFLGPSAVQKLDRLIPAGARSTVARLARRAKLL